MNEQEETLVRQSRWSGRRVVLFYWFAIVFLGTSAAAGLGTTVFKPVFNIEQEDPHAGIAEPWHADDCVACHPVTIKLSENLIRMILLRMVVRYPIIVPTIGELEITLHHQLIGHIISYSMLQGNNAV